jgi:hypothetical protein
VKHEIRRSDSGTPYVVFIPTEPGEMNLRPRGDSRRPEGYDGVLSSRGMSLARDIVGPVRLEHPSLGFPGVMAPDGNVYRISFDQGLELLGINK